LSPLTTTPVSAVLLVQPTPAAVVGSPGPDVVQQCVVGVDLEADRRLADVRAADAEVRAAKTLVASGVRAFELHEGAVLTKRYDALIDALRGLVPLTLDHLEAASRAEVTSSPRD
jgi:hypothetical protein